MSTPETDAVLARLVDNQSGNSCDAVVIHHARKLERERDEARKDTPWHSNGETKDEWFARQREKYAVLERDRDALRAEVEQLKADNARLDWRSIADDLAAALDRLDALYRSEQDSETQINWPEWLRNPWQRYQRALADSESSDAIDAAMKGEL